MRVDLSRSAWMLLLLGPAVSGFDGPAWAQVDLDTALLRPAVGQRGFLSGRSASEAAGRWDFGAWAQLERAPLVVAGPERPTPELVPLRAALQLGASWAVYPGIGVSASLPVFAMSSGWPSYQLPPVALGDLMLTGLWHATDLGPLRFNVFADLFLPTATAGALVGEGGPRVAPGVAAETELGPLALMSSAAVLLRAPVSTGHRLDVGSELAWMVGVASADRTSAVRWIIELHLRHDLKGPPQPGSDPVIVVAACELNPVQSSWSFTVAAGTALSSGYGAADLRAVLGVRFTFDSSPDDEEQLGPRALPPGQVPPDSDPVPLETLLELPPELASPSPPGGVRTIEVLPCQPLGSPIFFDQDSALLKPEAALALAPVVQSLQAKPHILDVIIEGHASIEGGAQPNWALSQARAVAVYQHLVDAGVSPRRLALRGLGEVERTAPPTEIRATDRRVELCIARAVDELQPLPAWSAETPPVPWIEPALSEGERSK